ncbi:Rrf2 family transcriptional regulator [Pseudomonas sp. SWRI153]|uniref:Rrf2 family transcriptional regulator n=1 Tax=Pseudomonas khorasanensis TaxID=2745508 RepID=A0A923JCQ7_9PSED|nr:Rrf2 family transcriptional regulator [Pseudomonas khorasanensis]MBV4484591.1 Rrf2 family transcriptional regulator [Pseudomonas khorasanensis]
MRHDNRLSRMLHILVHMARHGGPVTSERIAAMLGTNPVVVRRTLSGLRDAGYVRSEKGHGGGWVITCDLEQVTLLDIYKAVGQPSLFAIGNEHSNPDCMIEQVVNLAVDDALREAASVLVERFRTISLGELNRLFDERRAAGHDGSIS